jgi:hypothetical protein
VADLERWREHGAIYRVLELREERAVVQLCTCYGEPVELIESDDRDLIAYLRKQPEAAEVLGRTASLDLDDEH